MKKTIYSILCAALAVVLCFSFAACSGGESSDANSGSGIESSLALLTTVWDSYSEDERFPAVGGDYSEENRTEEAPGKYDISDAAALEQSMGIPADAAEMIDDAALLTHMMNTNTFTGFAVHLKNSSDAANFTDALRESLANRHWMCGFPDKMIAITVGDYVVAAFGHNENIDAFRDKTLAAFEGAELVFEEAIA